MCDADPQEPLSVPRLTLSPVEVDLMICALDRWSWSIAEKDASGSRNVFYERGHLQACRFTQRRIDELRERLVQAGASALISVPTTKQKEKA